LTATHLPVAVTSTRASFPPAVIPTGVRFPAVVTWTSAPNICHFDRSAPNICHFDRSAAERRNLVAIDRYAATAPDVSGELALDRIRRKFCVAGKGRLCRSQISPFRPPAFSRNDKAAEAASSGNDKAAEAASS
jgi:hypothetical protein